MLSSKLEIEMMEIGIVLNERTSFEKGTKSKIRKYYWDSKGEELLEKRLRSICADYELGKYMSVRVLPHQPVDNYVERTDIFAVDNRNHWMRFDFIFEEYKSHNLLLVLELDGVQHADEQQKERDQYKNGLCSAINVGIIRVEYLKKDDVENEELFRERYEAEIMLSMLKTYFSMSTWFGYERTLEQQKINVEKRYNTLRRIYGEAYESCKDIEKKKKYAEMCRYIEEAKAFFVPSSK